ncbi:MAG TPA: hypothetical protein VHS99_19475 [Chloroflexota bacterium]|jgi:hypothetical protein|nr:hypothetical protein [Chloroflexota bacterium]
MQSGQTRDAQDAQRAQGVPSGAEATPSVEDLLAVLRRQFGDRYERPYELGKREFRDAIADAFRLDKDAAGDLVDSLEASASIRFKSGGDTSTRDPSGPRVGLFDEPRPPVDETGAAEPGGRYWLLGRDDTAPGAF